MELTSPHQKEPFKAIIDRYERAFLERDLAAFRTLHVRDGRLVFFDNHSGCDSASYEDHEVKIAAFFKVCVLLTPSGGSRRFLVNWARETRKQCW